MIIAGKQWPIQDPKLINLNSMKTRKLFFILTILCCFSSAAYSQMIEYQYFDQQDGIKVEYRWSRSNIFDKNSDAVLRLQMTNENSYPVRIDFTVGFYRNEQLANSSLKTEICLNPGKRRRGSSFDMRFSAGDVSMFIVQQAWFSWDFIEFRVLPSSCD